MLYSSIIVAASALAGFAAAQNSTYNTPIQCCTVSPGAVPQDDRQTWCNANQNTCVELCGGQGSLASNGNQCDSETLKFSCNCRNGTDVSGAMEAYQQTVPGLMCRFWYDQCINATGSDAAAQFQCNQARDHECGNLTTQDATNSGNAASSSGSKGSKGSPSATRSGSSPNNTGSATPSGASATPTEGAASRIAFYGTPALAGGLFALFGFAL